MNLLLAIRAFFSAEAKHQQLINTLDSRLNTEEGRKAFPYWDTDKPPNCSIGVGRNLTAKGLRPDEIQLMYVNDRNEAIDNVHAHLPWVEKLSTNRQIVLYDMAFNEGIAGLMKWTDFLILVQAGKYSAASVQILNSLAARQDPRRYQNLAHLMETG